jgi:protein-S-isoprenylcysteine O-methyltransferase Ste14
MTERLSQSGSSPKLPQSAANFAVNLVALAVGLAVLYVMVDSQWTWIGDYLSYPPLLPCVAVFLVIAFVEWRLRRLGRLPALEGIANERLRRVQLARVALRLFGLAATLVLIAFAYWLFPEYSGTFYGPYWKFLRSMAPLLLLAPLYCLWIDSYVDEQHDELVEFGRLLLRRPLGAPALIRRHLLGWTVKGFFLPLMTVYLYNDYNSLLAMYRQAGNDAFGFYDFWFTLSYTIDLLFCVVGYSAAVRIFDSHIRSAEPTLLGWVAALVCYQPIYSIINQNYLPYEGQMNYWSWLQAWPGLRDAWAILIIGLLMIYALSTVAFGLRFSNLTHRGIITSGPYRFTKHPAYLSKNLSWWLISIPFITNQGAAVALRHCCALLLVNGLYFLRARTEERHLSRDPLYVAYARWIDAHGLLRGLGRVRTWVRPR